MKRIQKFVASAAFVGLAWLGFYLIAKVNFDSIGAAKSATALLVVGLILGRGAIWMKPPRLILAPIAAGALAIPFVILTSAFGSAIVLSLVFHAQFGISGADLNGFGPEIFNGIFYVSLIVFAAYALGNLWLRPRTLYGVATLALILANPLTAYIREFGFSRGVESDLHERLTEPTLDQTPERPDIILIYLEGLERTFARTGVFGDIYAPLAPYADMGVAYTGIGQVNGTGWSLAGLVATQCGVPLIPNGLRFYARLDEQRDFMSSRLCLSDVAANEGYDSTFILGSIQDFGGYNHFFRSHQFTQIIDQDVLLATRPKAETDAASAGWVLDDQLSYDVAAEVYDAKKTQDAPMLLVIETYGPHGTSAIVSRGCTPDGQAAIAPDLSSSIICTLQDTVKFLEHIKTTRRDRPTVIMLSSDHLNHDPSMDERFDITDRTNTVIMLTLGEDNPAVSPGTLIDRAGSMVDVFPTLLAYTGLGPADVSAGLGRSLLGAQPTFVEEKGLARFNAELFPNPVLNRAIWGQPAD